MTTRKQAIAERKHLHPSELEKVRTVYGETVYIPRDRKPNRLIPMYTRNGTPRVVLVDRGRYRPDMLHPDNIYRPDMPPLGGDYVLLLDANGKPSENHAEVFMTRETITEGVYLIEEMQGECYAVSRYPDLDTLVHRAWRQVVPEEATV